MPMDESLATLPFDMTMKKERRVIVMSPFHWPQKGENDASCYSNFKASLTLAYADMSTARGLTRQLLLCVQHTRRETKRHSLRSRPRSTWSGQPLRIFLHITLTFLSFHGACMLMLTQGSGFAITGRCNFASPRCCPPAPRPCRPSCTLALLGPAVVAPFVVKISAI